MRFGCGILTTVGVVAAIALTTPAALAVEITDEASSEHCSEVVVVDEVPTGGCPMLFVSEERVLFGGNDVGTAGLCEFQFEMRLDEAGVGYIYDQLFTECAGVLMAPCPEGSVSGAPLWPVQMYTDLLGNYLMEAEMCIQVGSVLAQCHLVDFPFQQIDHDNAEMRFDQGPGIMNFRMCEGAPLRSPVWAFAHFTYTSDEDHPPFEVVD